MAEEGGWTRFVFLSFLHLAHLLIRSGRSSAISDGARLSQESIMLGSEPLTWERSCSLEVVRPAVVRARSPKADSLFYRTVSTHNYMGATAVADYLSLQFEHVASIRETMVDCAVQTDNHHREETLHADDDHDNEEDMAYKDLSLRDVQAIIQGSLTLGANINVTATMCVRGRNLHSPL